MPRFPLSQISVENVLDLLDGNDSEYEGFESEHESDDEFIPYSEVDIESDDQDRDDAANPSGDPDDISSDWDSDDDVPLANIAKNMAKDKITSTDNYKWRNCTFVPPADTLFRGDTKLPELPTLADGEITPYSLFKMFITVEMLQSVAEETNKYSVEKDGRSVNTTPLEMDQLIGMLFYMGLVQMPNLRSYWESDMWFEPVASVMSRDRFLKLVTVIHFVDNNAVTDDQKLDKLWKLRSWFDALRKNFLKIPPKECQSIDEIIIPFKGRSSLRVYMPNKPHKWGFKLWGRSDSDGFIYDFDLYQPTRPNEQISNLGRSAGVVEKMTESLPDGENFKAFADNYFSSVALAEKLKKRQILYIGTVRMNRVKGNKLATDKELKKKGRGHFVSQVEKNTNVVCVRWNDNKVVSLISSYVGTEPVTKARRWDKKAKQFVEIDRPKIVEQYNNFMGGIDLLNMCTNLYKYHVRSRRWYMYLFFHSLTMSLVNAWFLYRRHHAEIGTNKKNVMPLRKFQSTCANSLTNAGKGKKRARGRPSLEERASLQNQQPHKQRYVSVPADVQKDEFNHFPIYDKVRQRCKVCPRSQSAFSYIKCIKCNAHLCLNKDRNCFLAFHK